jgi:hypothetical protein
LVYLEFLSSKANIDSSSIPAKSDSNVSARVSADRERYSQFIYLLAKLIESSPLRTAERCL